jgi:hypothetical protein
VFKYEKTLDEPGGQLVDYFSSVDNNQDPVRGLFDLYKTVFENTLITRTCEVGEPADIFYRNRVKTRLLSWYDQSLIRGLDRTPVSFNGVNLKIYPGNLLEEVEDYFSATRTIPCIISQCDPQDLNLGTKPVVMDFRAGGYTPLMAEFASFLWFNLAMGNYLAPLLNPATYKNKSDIFNALDTLECSQEEGGMWHIQHSLSARRRWAVREYTSRVLEPLLNKYETWFGDLMPHLTMRALTVFNLSKDREKLLFALSYITYMRNLRTKNAREFIENILKLYD